MHKYFILTFLTISLLAFYACEEKAVPTLNEQFGFDQQVYKDEIRSLFTNKYFSNLNDSTRDKSLDSLYNFYLKRNFVPIFLTSFDKKNFVDSLLSIIGSAGKHGLNPENYNATEILNKFNECLTANVLPVERHKLLAAAELVIAEGVLKYSKHMRNGIVNPRKLYPETHNLPVTDSLNTRFLESFMQQDVIKYLIDIQPKNKIYKRLQLELERFENLVSEKWEPIRITDKKIEPGSKSELIKPILERLNQLGFIDTANFSISDTLVYDSSLVHYVKLFQKTQGLADDGVIGKSTVERLNLTPSEYVEKIKLNLERFRWYDYGDTSKYIFVNIPDFKVYAIENGKEIFDIKVCTGRKIDWQTVTMYGQISYFVLNPTWSVPKSIIKEEIVNGLRKDSTYLVKRSFKVYKSGERIDLSEVTAKDLATSDNYVLIQDPGAGNALGKIKFMWNNPFGIYLHDTPTRAPFGYVNRAVSHGCVRVEKPMMLAEYLLKDNSKWNLDFLKLEIGQNVSDQSIRNEFAKERDKLRKGNSYGVTTEVKLFKKIPVFIDYFTTWVDKDGKLNFRDDVYDRDKILFEKIKSYF